MNSDRTSWGRAVLMLVCVFAMMLPLSCEDTNYDEEGDWDELAIAKTKSGCEGKCSPSCQCNWTETGCETDDDCSSGLRCEIRPQLGNRCLKAKDGGSTSDNTTTPDKDCHEFKPGHGSYCSDSCKCKEGEGDCDKDSQCMSGLVCKQRDGTDFCEKPAGGGDDGQDDDDGGNLDVGSAKSNLQVRLGGVWKGVCCNGGELELSGASCKWKEGGRVLTTKDVRTGSSTALNCPENGQRPTDCNCRLPGERMHGINVNGNVSVANSLRKSNGAPIYPNSGHETCVDLVGGKLESRWESSTCPNWRLTNFY